jgi:two-component sensor histidine kinase
VIGVTHDLVRDSVDPHNLREITDAAARSLTNPEHTKLVFMSEGEAIVTAEQAAAIGLFVGEAIVNSLKYAHPIDHTGTIWIACKRADAGRLLIKIADDGAGLPADLESSEERSTGTGTHLMRCVALSLNAKLEFTKGHPGHIVRLRLPLLVELAETKSFSWLSICSRTNRLIWVNLKLPQEWLIAIRIDRGVVRWRKRRLVLSELANPRCSI